MIYLWFCIHFLFIGITCTVSVLTIEPKNLAGQNYYQAQLCTLHDRKLKFQLGGKVCQTICVANTRQKRLQIKYIADDENTKWQKFSLCFIYG